MTDLELLLETARERIAAEAHGVASVANELGESTATAARLLLGCQGKVFVSGSGTSGTIARRMAHIFSVTGTPSLFLPPMDALHGTLGAVSAGDIVIVISKGGGSGEINELITRVQDRGAVVIALTARDGTAMTDNADLTVLIGQAPDLDLGDMIAMGSTLAHAVWGDALATVLMRARGYSWERVHHSHPSGAVGAKSSLPESLETLRVDPLDPTQVRAGM